MTKADIVNEVSKKTGIEKVVVQKALESSMDAIKKALKELKMDVIPNILDDEKEIKVS